MSDPPPQESTGDRQDVAAHGAVSISNNQATNPAATGYFDERNWELDGVTNWRETDDGTTTISRSVNNVNEYTAVDSVSRAHDANGNLVWNGTHLFYYDALNRLVRVERDDGSSLGTIANNSWDAKDRRVAKDVDDTGFTGSTNVEEDLLFYYLGQTLIEEQDAGSPGKAGRQWVFGALGDRFLETVGDLAQLEKLDGSIAVRVNSSREPVAAYDYWSQGEVTVWDPGASGNYFLSDDGAQDPMSNAHVKTYGHYYSQDRRFDLETGMYLGGAGTRFYDPENGRKLQPSADMWQSSLWGLRYNSFVYKDKKCTYHGLHKAYERTYLSLDGNNALQVSVNKLNGVGGIGIGNSTIWNCCSGTKDWYRTWSNFGGFGLDTGVSAVINHEVSWTLSDCEECGPTMFAGWTYSEVYSFGFFYTLAYSSHRIYRGGRPGGGSSRSGSNREFLHFHRNRNFVFSRPTKNLFRTAGQHLHDEAGVHHALPAA